MPFCVNFYKTCPMFKTNKQNKTKQKQFANAFVQNFFSMNFCRHPTCAGTHKLYTVPQKWDVLLVLTSSHQQLWWGIQGQQSDKTVEKLQWLDTIERLCRFHRDWLKLCQLLQWSQPCKFLEGTFFDVIAEEFKHFFHPALWKFKWFLATVKE